MHRKNELQLEVMEALQLRPMALFELGAHLKNGLYRGPAIAEATDELIAAGFVVLDNESSSTRTIYKPATETSLSDLTAKLLPHRDPVREAHEYEQGQVRRTRYRQITQQGADLGDDD